MHIEELFYRTDKVPKLTILIYKQNCTKKEAYLHNCIQYRSPEGTLHINKNTLAKTN